MAGIVGIERGDVQDQVARMLELISHRGQAGSKIIESHGTTLGAVWSEADAGPTPPGLRSFAVWDGSGPPMPHPSALEGERGDFALTAALDDGIFLARDPLGIRPLYYGHAADGAMCFASEVKALLPVASNVQEFPPGVWYDRNDGFQPYFEAERGPELGSDAQPIAAALATKIEKAVMDRIDGDATGSWLSGNLNSAALAAMARPHVAVLHTFAVGTPGTPDLGHAARAASLLDTEHHELTVTFDDVLAPLPAVIWHLESFDVPLVRASVTRFLAAERAADYVGTMLFDDGADELFSASSSHREARPEDVADELVETAQSLHSTVLQQVDRTASSQGLVARVPFLDMDLLEYAMSIPVGLKLPPDGGIADKWILRRALSNVLPPDMLQPPDIPLWQGAGVGLLLALRAEEQITDQEYHRERVLRNGWILEDKEALMYYRIFREQFGDLEDLSWMGRRRPPNGDS